VGLDQFEPGDYEFILQVEDKLSGRAIDQREAFTIGERTSPPPTAAAPPPAEPAPAAAPEPASAATATHPPQP
jgi:hypothetical protein